MEQLHIIRQAQALDVNYSLVEMRAMELGLESLLHWICRPLNLGAYVSATSVNTPMKYDWTYMINNLSPGDDVTIKMTEVGSEMRLNSGVIVGRAVRCGTIDSRRQRMDDQQLHDLLTQLFYSKPFSHVSELTPSVIPFFWNIQESLTIKNGRKRQRIDPAWMGFQDQIASKLYYSSEPTDEQLIGLPHQLVLDILNYQIMRHDIIMAILDYKEPVTVHNVYLDINQLRLLNYIISNGIPARITDFSAELQCHAQYTQYIVGMLSQMYDNVIVRQQPNRVIIDILKLEDLPPIDALSFNPLEGTCYEAHTLKRLAYVIESLHTPVNLFRTNISN